MNKSQQCARSCVTITIRNYLIICFVFFISAGFGPKTIKSNLYVPANEEFILGGEQPFSFKVSAKNVGLVKVQLLLSLDGKETDLGFLERNESIDAIVPEKVSVLIRNQSSIRAHLKVTAKGKSDNLGMNYRKVD